MKEENSIRVLSLSVSSNFNYAYELALIETRTSLRNVCFSKRLRFSIAIVKAGIELKNVLAALIEISRLFLKTLFSKINIKGAIR